MAVEYTSAIIGVAALMFFLVDFAFRIQAPVKDGYSVFDMSDVLKGFLFALSFLLGLVLLNLAWYSISGNTASMDSLFNLTIGGYTLALLILLVLVIIYIFFMLPNMVKKIKFDKQREEEENGN